ncbi:SDR family NAD(P)-dependent oxidoreductase [Bacteroides thetaiotaomicron]|uniref:SDR family NAD(P)-dependent oxidoreductase n=1 Tax=Bacteroides thetaiotaomicron TaxID=818 RepID=UPI0018A0106D|nr:SDR family NAD(P)-dependent oxidoreductase [Bacteroides thetaiotaomicron]MDC2172607.1 SDR family NAD(P)-dependent oxidoreductase [Bacteroides thetaiotaomicron]MDC2187835.1 SDR family NAD(P)-dependent oxidoreductase [Bacteroides thetaiotaomicron]
MKSKIILVTGSSDGIGKETAKTLAKQGHTIIMHGRNPEKTKAAYEEVKKESGNDKVKYYLADFLSLAEVRKFADKIKEKYDYLDVLINNAGAQFTNKRETTVEGHEKTMTINIFAPHLLTEFLLPLLEKSKSARVVTVASAAHKMSGKPYLDDIELKNNYSMAKSYGISKLYVIWIMQHFVKEMQKRGISNVAFYTVHPGSAQTSLGRESTGSLGTKIIYFLWKVMMNSVAEGAAPSIRCATAPELEGVTGKYYGLKGEEKPSEKYYTPQNEQKIWDYSMNVIKPYL